MQQNLDNNREKKQQKTCVLLLHDLLLLLLSAVRSVQRHERSCLHIEGKKMQQKNKYSKSGYCSFRFATYSTKNKKPPPFPCLHATEFLLPSVRFLLVCLLRRFCSYSRLIAWILNVSQKPACCSEEMRTVKPLQLHVHRKLPLLFTYRVSRSS